MYLYTHNNSPYIPNPRDKIHFEPDRVEGKQKLSFLLCFPAQDSTRFELLTEQARGYNRKEEKRKRSCDLFGDMEVAVELEDDLFFADLSKQISLLIMDDDEAPAARCPSVAFQGFSRENFPTAPSASVYEQNCRREGKGTGVFIPRCSQPRRKHRQARANSRHHDQNPTRSVTSQASYSNSFDARRSC